MFRLLLAAPILAVAQTAACNPSGNQQRDIEVQVVHKAEAVSPPAKQAESRDIFEGGFFRVRGVLKCRIYDDAAVHFDVDVDSKRYGVRFKEEHLAQLVALKGECVEVSGECTPNGNYHMDKIVKVAR